jgi:hypothetical protein
MAGYDVLGYDVLGDDVEGDGDLLGDDGPFAVTGRARRAGGLRNARWAQQLRQGAPGAPAISEMMLPLGLATFTFTAGGPTSAVLTAQPQLAFRGERVVLSGIGPGQLVGPTALDAITVGDIKVGQRSQLVSAQPLPGSAFSAIAFGVRTALDPCAPGILISVAISYIGPTLVDAETFSVSGVIFGRSAG